MQTNAKKVQVNIDPSGSVSTAVPNGQAMPTNAYEPATADSGH